MRKLVYLLLAGLVICPCFSYAIWQVNDPSHGTKPGWYLSPFLRQTDMPQQYVQKSAYTIHLKKEWLKSEVTDISRKYGWRLYWKAPQNYPILLKTDIVGDDFETVMNELLSHYPLKAAYNKHYRIITVLPAGQSVHQK